MKLNHVTISVLRSMAANGMKSAAIKYLRLVKTGLGLREAKELMDKDLDGVSVSGGITGEQDALVTMLLEQLVNQKQQHAGLGNMYTRACASREEDATEIHRLRKMVNIATNVKDGMAEEIFKLRAALKEAESE